MLARPRLDALKALQCCRRAYATKWPFVRAMEQVPNNSSIQDSQMGEPCILSHDQFNNIDAIYDWFKPIDRKAEVHSLKTEKFRPYAATVLPLEYTGPDPADSSKTIFKRFNAPLGVFLDYLEQPPERIRLYLAQCKIDDLPTPLRRLLPAPPFVQHHGWYNQGPKFGRRRGSQGAELQIYDTSIWMGLPPTYTPLHRDPNPNCFFQMAGKKTVRLFSPQKGLEIFQRVKMSIGEGEGDLSGKIRGEEMMMGKEREALEKEVWDDGSYDPELGGLEAKLERGHGLYIPEGWWHSVKGHGSGVTASVNWWFRWGGYKLNELPPYKRGRKDTNDPKKNPGRNNSNASPWYQRGKRRWEDTDDLKDGPVPGKT